MRFKYPIFFTVFFLCGLGSVKAQQPNTSANYISQTILADGIGKFEGDFAPVEVKGNRQFLHRSGKVMVDKVEESRMGGLHIVVKGDAYGALNDEGKIIADFGYDEIKEESDYDLDGFNEVKKIYYQFLIVKRNGKFGVIDKDGKEICPVIYDAIEGINENVFSFKKDGHWGWADLKTGKVLQQPIFAEVSKMYNTADYVQIEKGEKVGMAKIDGTVILPTNFGYVHRFQNNHQFYIAASEQNKMGLYSFDGKPLLPMVFDVISTSQTPGVLRVRKNGKHGLITISGKEIVPAVYETIEEAIDGLMVAKKIKYGVIDMQGREILPFVFDNIQLGNGNNFGVVAPPASAGDDSDKDKSTIHPPMVTETVVPFIITKRGYQTGVYTWKGKALLPLDYDYIEMESKNGKIYFVARKKGKTGLIDEHGKTLLPLEYSSVNLKDYSFSKSPYYFAPLPGADNMAMIKQGDSMGCYDVSKQKMIFPPIYRRLSWHPSGLIVLEKADTSAEAREYKTLKAVARADGSIMRPFSKELLYYPLSPNRVVEAIYHQGEYGYSLTDENGKVLYLNPGWTFKDAAFNKLLMGDADKLYDQGAAFQNGLFKIGGKQENLFIDSMGQETRFEKYFYVGDFWNGLAVAFVESATRQRTYGIIDRNGNEVLPVVYDRLEQIYNYKNLILLQKGKMYGVADIKGKMVIEPVYDRIDTYGRKRYFKVEKNGKKGILKTDGTVLVEPVYDELEDNDLWPVLAKQAGVYFYLLKDGSKLPVQSKNKLGYSY